ncbi:uncharacterized protein PHALS_05412 [Plasmopara halstedii]|uniref:WRKY19-like zinc finger domain-containing protein n=1 Tax=Plasmopara halstedii TaxID=4781 RepID=A0A0P1AA58_PLAHL|nr:uncharacterized protein PHALS_05412 [Plasmopara halstedii]CEG37634.1 hypothetical protein PHALS_05412 [Plasmopara halstedii]|eukprot:XP_024574003.1 hypothetical protein PHALS_05412 [Plasmopara halstedii]
MFPPIYDRTTSCPEPLVPLLPSVKTLDLYHVSKHELEPFDFHSTTMTPQTQAGSSLSSVFGDQDLIDAIMCSLTTEMHHQVSIPPLNPLFHRVSPTVRTTVTSHRTLSNSTLSSRTFSEPCLRKPGTFLNKDGRWIKGKPCHMDGCDKRAQSNGLCKGHGGGARCSFTGCSKSSQGGGFCRAHGGGKRCLYDGCDKGTQRNGFCYLHGGVRSCSTEGCEKKDRGNGKCFSHGGGRKCQAQMCFHTIRRGIYCDLHHGGRS